MKGTKKKSPTAKKQPKPHPVDIYIGKRIRHFRHLWGMSQADIVE